MSVASWPVFVIFRSTCRMACQSARPINLLIAWLVLALCTQGHSAQSEWARDWRTRKRRPLASRGDRSLPGAVLMLDVCARHRSAELCTKKVGRRLTGVLRQPGDIRRNPSRFSGTECLAV
jgi:hypothetical protein